MSDRLRLTAASLLIVMSGLLLSACDDGSSASPTSPSPTGVTSPPPDNEVAGGEEPPEVPSDDNGNEPPPSNDGGAVADAIDLSHWKLTLPINANGGTSGDPLEIRPAALVSGYSRAPWFFRDSGDALVFWAPVNGTPTDNAKYARSELRELIDPRDERRNWSLEGLSTLDASGTVERVPTSTGKVVIGQIHAFQSAPLIKLRYHYQPDTHSGRIDALVNQKPGSRESSSYAVLTGLELGETFSYRISVDDHVLTVHASGGKTVRLPIDPAWHDERFYFKAGSYVQARGASSNDGAELRFTRIVARHSD